MDVLLCFDANEVDLGDLSSWYGHRGGWEEDWLQHSESADLHLFWEGGETGCVGCDPTPATSHACQANLGGANLPTLGALGVGRKIAFSVVVLSQNLGQSLPGVVGGALHTVWHSEFLAKTRQTDMPRDQSRLPVQWKGKQLNQENILVVNIVQQPADNRSSRHGEFIKMTVIGRVAVMSGKLN